MDVKQIKKGDLIIKKDSVMDNLWYIVDGGITMDYGTYKIELQKGDFVGLADFDTGIHSYNYYATEDSQLMAFSSRDNLYNSSFYISKPENCRALALSLNRMVRESYQQLSDLCTLSSELNKTVFDAYGKFCEYTRELHMSVDIFSAMDEAPEPISMSINQKMIFATHNGVYNVLAGKESASSVISKGIVSGYMLHAILDLHEVSGAIEYVKGTVDDSLDLLMVESEDDIYGRLGSLLIKATSDHPIAAEIKALMEEIYETVHKYSPELAEARKYTHDKKIESIGGVSGETSDKSESMSSVASKLIGSLDSIIKFCNYPEERAAKLKEAVSAFKNLSDPYSTDNDVRRLRSVIEENFYTLYLAVLEARLESVDVPILIKMFLDFGYLDEELAGMKNACELYNICLSYSGDKDKGVYTASEWLTAIFLREREPSINEFEQSFEEYIREQVTNGRISDQQAKAIVADRGQKVMFELQNMFRRTSKICSGQILSFCPILCEYQLMRGPKEDLIDPQIISEAINNVKAIDYSIFYRETMFIFSEKENIHDVIHVEVLPDIILMPVVGSRGIMWQEISGRDRMTHARMMFPIINVENLEKIVLKVLGDYRWEMCKRMQGMRWNDVTDPSLTSLYCDYLQFYRKNSDVSPEQKEKIKLGLQRYKQNFKEYFSSDYANYIKYESAGSPHLNKVARGILYSQCPFRAEVRKKLTENPIYNDISEKYRIKVAQHLRKLENIIKKLNSKGQEVPIELKKEIEFYNM
ncbi:MAG: cyclic nucleotide-binding domain-containing protein [Lachnospiraceae bacterium]|nr:cyclic nucleotide-binding domain-containing protein [Lachnospiraceae bacterium]